MKYRPCGYLKIIVILQPFKYYYLCDGNITQMCLLIKSRIEMRKNLNWDNKTLKKIMEFLKNKGYIDYKTTPQNTFIKVLNYKKWRGY